MLCLIMMFTAQCYKIIYIKPSLEVFAKRCYVVDR